VLALEEMLQGFDDGGIGGVLEAHAIGKHVTHVGIRDEHLAKGPHPLIGGEESLPLRRGPFTAQDDADAAAQDPLALTRGGASRAIASV